MAISLVLGETKSNISLVLEGKGTAGYTLDNAEGTLDEADGTLDNPKLSLSRESKSKISLSLEAK